MSSDSATDGSAATDSSDTVQEGNAQSEKPKKHVRFKSPSSDSDEAPPEYIQRSQQVIRKPLPCIVDTSDSDANEIPNVEETRNQPLSIIDDKTDSDANEIPNVEEKRNEPLSIIVDTSAVTVLRFQMHNHVNIALRNAMQMKLAKAMMNNHHRKMSFHLFQTKMWVLWTQHQCHLMISVNHCVMTEGHQQALQKNQLQGSM